MYICIPIYVYMYILFCFDDPILSFLVHSQAGSLVLDLPKLYEHLSSGSGRDACQNPKP